MIDWAREFRWPTILTLLFGAVLAVAGFGPELFAQSNGAGNPFVSVVRASTTKAAAPTGSSRGEISVRTADGRTFLLVSRSNGDFEGYTGSNSPYQCVDLVKRYAQELGFGSSALGNGHQVAANFAAISRGKFQFIRNGAAVEPPLPGSVISIASRDQAGRNFAEGYGHVGIAQKVSISGQRATVTLFDQNWPSQSWKTVDFVKKNGRWYGEMQNNPRSGPAQTISVEGWADPVPVKVDPPGGSGGRPPSVGRPPYLESQPPRAPDRGTPGSSRPANATLQQAEVLLSWSAVQGATSYKVEATDQSNGRQSFQSNVVRTEARAKLASGKTYGWTVRACNLVGCSEPSRPSYIRTGSSTGPVVDPPRGPGGKPPAQPTPPPGNPAGPTIKVPSVPGGLAPGRSSSPGRLLSSRSVRLEWSAVAGADEYDFGIRDTRTNRLVVDQRTRRTSFDTSLTHGTTYRWNVRACNRAGCSAFTEPLYFTIEQSNSSGSSGGSGSGSGSSGGTSGSTKAPPQVPGGAAPGRSSSPGRQTSSTIVRIEWSGVANATTYDFGIRDMTTNRLVVDTQTSRTSYTVKLDPRRTYRWNVRACNSYGCSAFTQPLYFNTP